MSSHLGQLGMDITEDVSLYRYPSELTEDHFSMRKIFNSNERYKGLEIEIFLISPVEFSVKASHSAPLFNDILNDNKNLKRRKISTNEYVVNLKHYLYVSSRVKRLHERYEMTINVNKFDRNFINALIKNLNQNDNIIGFIDNPETRMSLIDSLAEDPKFGKSMDVMSGYKMFEDLKEHQLIAFYMSVVRNGKSILADNWGKSLTALTIMTYFRKEWPLVIICHKQRKKYWKNVLKDRYVCTKLFKITIIDSVKDIYVYPNPFHDIMVIDYDLFYQIKDTVSFKNLNLKAIILEDQTRGQESPSRRPWKGLSECTEFLQRVNRIIFISSQSIDSSSYKRLWPLLTVLDPKIFDDYEWFELRYCDEEHTFRQDMLQEFQILLRSTFLICDNTYH